MNRLKLLRDFVLDRMGEGSTWSAIGFVLTACGVKFARNVDWPSASAVGAFVSAGIKGIFPDKLK